MKTMYILTAAHCEPYYGRYDGEEIIDKYNTIEEARESAKEIVPSLSHTGNWTIVAKTMDEETFVITEKIIEYYDWDEEHRGESYMKDIERIKWAIAETEKSKKRCRSESGIARKSKEIERLKKRLAEKEADLTAWMEKRKG